MLGIIPFLWLEMSTKGDSIYMYGNPIGEAIADLNYFMGIGYRLMDS